MPMQKQQLVTGGMLFSVIVAPVLAVTPALAMDVDKRVHQLVGEIKGSGETLTASVYLDWNKVMEEGDAPPLEITMTTSTGTTCTGQLNWSVNHESPRGTMTCSDWRAAEFGWGTGCTEHIITVVGEIAGAEFRLYENFPGACER